MSLLSDGTDVGLERRVGGREKGETGEGEGEGEVGRVKDSLSPVPGASSLD